MDGYSTTTDNNGFYVLNAISDTYSSIVISKSGYITQTLSGITLSNGQYDRRNSQLLSDDTDYGQLRLISSPNTSVNIYGPIAVDDIIDVDGIIMVSALPSGTYYITYHKQGYYSEQGFTVQIVNNTITTETFSSDAYSDKKTQISGMVLQQLEASSSYEPYDDSKFVNYKQAKYSSKILKLDDADINYNDNSIVTDDNGIYSIDTSENRLSITASKESDNFYSQELSIGNLENGKYYSRSYILINDIKQIEVYTLIKTEEKFNKWTVLLGTNYGVLGARF